MLTTARLAMADRAAWEALARGYKRFYETELPDRDYEQTWARLLADRDVHGLAAHLDGRLVGIVHFLFHGNIWLDRVCYLQDLFVDETVRGRGVARALIEAVAAAAHSHGAARLYWQTKVDNARARLLYDKLAHYGGFIRYDYPL